MRINNGRVICAREFVGMEIIFPLRDKTIIWIILIFRFVFLINIEILFDPFHTIGFQLFENSSRYSVLFKLKRKKGSNDDAKKCELNSCKFFFELSILSVCKTFLIFNVGTFYNPRKKQWQ